MTNAPATTPANDNKPTAARPASFDDRIIAYLPGLYRLARKHGRRGDARHDLVNDTIVYALEHWTNFREDGGLWNWLSWQMRGLVSNGGKRGTLHIVDDRDGMKAARHVMDPTQQTQAELSETLRRLRGRDGAVLLRRAMGEELHVIAGELGISTERVRQLEARERARLREMGEAA